MTDRSTVIRHMPEGFDYSTPEAQVALEGITAIVLEIRDDFKWQAGLGKAYNTLDQSYLTVTNAYHDMESAHAEMVDLYLQANARIALYERTLGFAVIPILIRRAAMRLLGRSGEGKAASEVPPETDDGSGGQA